MELYKFAKGRQLSSFQLDGFWDLEYMSITKKINSYSSRKDWHVWVFEVMIYTSMSLQVFLWLHVKVFPQFLGSGAIWIQHTCKRPIKLNDHLNPFFTKTQSVNKCAFKRALNWATFIDFIQHNINANRIHQLSFISSNNHLFWFAE